MIKHGVEFQREAVRIALTSGLPRKRVAADLGIGLSTLTRWVPTELGLICRIWSKEVYALASFSLES